MSAFLALLKLVSAQLPIGRLNFQVISNDYTDFEPIRVQ